MSASQQQVAMISAAVAALLPPALCKSGFVGDSTSVELIIKAMAGKAGASVDGAPMIDPEAAASSAALVYGMVMSGQSIANAAVNRGYLGGGY